MRKHYVCGFAFEPGQNQVLLIEKKKPEWQAGRYNGIGGKVEPNETALTAMVREFREETGHADANPDFRLFATVIGKTWRVDFFRCLALREDMFYKIAAEGGAEDECVFSFEVLQVLNDPRVLPNLRWLIPMALDLDIDGPVVVYDCSEAGNGMASK